MDEMTQQNAALVEEAAAAAESMKEQARAMGELIASSTSAPGRRSSARRRPARRAAACRRDRSAVAEAHGGGAPARSLKVASADRRRRHRHRRTPPTATASTTRSGKSSSALPEARGRFDPGRWGMSDEPVREFELTAGDFRRVQALIRARVGIDLGTNKQSLVYGRLARRLRALGMHHFADYLALVEDPASDEAERFVNALTTNVTEFFRENHHFEFVARTVLPAIWRRTGPGAQRVRFWSAGCSTGEEPYSLAMVLRENAPPASAAGAWDIKVLATDLDTDVLAHARDGIYPAERVEKIAPARLKRFFTRSRAGGTYQASRRAAIADHLQAAEPDGRLLADAGAVRRHLLSQRRDLLRRRHQAGAGAAVPAVAERRRASACWGIRSRWWARRRGFESCGRTIYRRSGRSNSQGLPSP